MLHIIIIVATVIVAILLIGVVLIQKSKGGGLSSQFAGANAVMGVRQTKSGIENLTWTLAGLIVLLSIISAFTMPKVSADTAIRTQQTETPAVPANQFDSQSTPDIPAADNQGAE